MADINSQLINANVQLVDNNKVLNKENIKLKEVINKAVNFIYDKSIEYKPNYRKVDLNTKECCELLDILEDKYDR